MKVALIRAMLMLGIWGKKVTALQNSLDLMAKTTSPMCDLVTFISSSGRARAGAGRRPVPAASRSVGRSGCIRADGTEGQDLPPPIWSDQLALIPVGADYTQSLSIRNISLINNLSNSSITRIYSTLNFSIIGNKFSYQQLRNE